MKNMKKDNFNLFSFVLIVLLSFFVGCGQKQESESQGNIKFKDIKGREVTLKEPAKRIFLGFYEESYLAVAKDFSKVVSIAKGEWADFFSGQYKAYEEQMPEIKNIVDTGSVYKGSFSMETLLKSRPDVAILAPFQYDTLGENIDKLEASGIKVVVIDYNSQTLDRHLESTRILGKVTGNEKRAEILAKQYEDAIKDVEKKVANVKNKKKVYVELGNLGAKEIGNSYGNYLWGSLVKTAGGNNIAEGKVESYGPLSPEYILQVNPEVVFLAGSRWTNDAGDRVLIGFGVKPEQTSQRMTPYTQRVGWEKLDAIKNGNVFAVDHGGLRTIYDYVYVQYIAKALYPELFVDVEPMENLKNFYKEYLPINPEGTFMIQHQN